MFSEVFLCYIDIWLLTWQLHKKCYPRLPTWNMFAKEFSAHFDRESHFLGGLTKLRQTGSVLGVIMTFEELAIQTKGLYDEFYLECFINGLKESIKTHVSMHHPTTRLHEFQLTLEEDTIL
jgi:hypothetical protein